MAMRTPSFNLGPLHQVLPPAPSLVSFQDSDGSRGFALARDGDLYDLTASAIPFLRSFDALLSVPLSDVRSALENPDIVKLPKLVPVEAQLLAPIETQEVWAAGVTYLRSRDARIEEAAAQDIYSLVYDAERPELFFKAAGWRVVRPGGNVGVRSDSEWDVPEPELAVLSNARGEVVAYSCGNDMSSRSIEGANPLYLPQAKVYDDSCAIGPAAVLAWHVAPHRSRIRMRITRADVDVFRGEARISDMVRDLGDLSRAVHRAYTLPVGVWLLTGTAIVPPLPYTAQPGDIVHIAIDGLGELCNEVRLVEGYGGSAPPSHMPL